MPLLRSDRLPAPTALLTDLRRSSTASTTQHQQILDAWDLRPLSGDSAGHYITRLNDVWPAQLAEHASDPQTGEMLALLRTALARCALETTPPARGRIHCST